MDLADLPAYLKAFRDVAATAPAPAANAMAQAAQSRIRDYLHETVHPPFTFYRAIAGRPPAYATGNLSRSIIATPAYGSVRVSAAVSTNLIYSAVQEWGDTMHAHGTYMHWRNPRPWWKKTVHVPAHPYFEPAVLACIRDGTLTRVSMNAFYLRIALWFNR